MRDINRCEYILGKIYSDFHDPEKLLKADLIKATLLYDMGEINKAIDFVKEKLLEAPEGFKVYWLHNLSTYYYEEGDYKQSLKYLKDNLDVAKDRKIRILSQNMMADAYIKLNMYVEADEILDEIHDELMELGNVFHNIEWYENKIYISEEMQTYEMTESLILDVLSEYSNYSNIHKWFVEIMEMVLSKRIQNGDSVGKHCLSIQRMMHIIK